MSNVKDAKHIRGSKVKYAQGTIVTTEKGRRAQVQADGRWRWLPSLVVAKSDNPPNIIETKQVAVINNEPNVRVTKKRKVMLVNRLEHTPQPTLEAKVQARTAANEPKKRKRKPLISVASQDPPAEKKRKASNINKGWSSLLPSFLQ